MEVVRSRLSAVNETLEKVRNESPDRNVIGEVFGLLANTINFEFAVGISSSRKFFTFGHTYHRHSGPDSTLRTAVSVSQACCAMPAGTAR